MVDEETAPIVRDIFQLRLEGISYQNIARRLTEQGVPSPSQYRYAKGLLKKPRFADVPWRIETVKSILSNEVYLGHMVQGRKRESLFQGERQKYLPKEEWIIVHDTHEPIIDQLLFDQVQQLNSVKTQEYESKQERFAEVVNTENILKGLVCCGDCGTKLVRYKNVRENKHKEPRFHVWYSYICPLHTANPQSCCFHSIPEKELLETAFQAVQGQMRIADDVETRLKKMTGKTAGQKKKDSLELQIRQAEDTLRRTRRHWESLYDDYADHLMNEHDYIYAQERYREKEILLEKQLSELNLSYQAAVDEMNTENPWLKGMLKFHGQPTLTREMAETLIEKITVYDRNTVHIDFRFQDEYPRLMEQLSSETEAAV